MTDGSKFLSGNFTHIDVLKPIKNLVDLGTMAALSIMVNLELPHVNILSKMDLLSKTARRRLERFLEPDSHAILGKSFSRF